MRRGGAEARRRSRRRNPRTRKARERGAPGSRDVRATSSPQRVGQLRTSLANSPAASATPAFTVWTATARHRSPAEHDRPLRRQPPPLSAGPIGQPRRPAQERPEQDRRALPLGPPCGLQRPRGGSDRAGAGGGARHLPAPRGAPVSKPAHKAVCSASRAYAGARPMARGRLAFTLGRPRDTPIPDQRRHSRAPCASPAYLFDAASLASPSCRA